MNLKTYNKALASQLSKAFNIAFIQQPQEKNKQVTYCNDTDSVKYKTVAYKLTLTLYFFAVDIKVIWNYCSQYLKTKHYEKIKIQLRNINNADCLQITVDNDSLSHFTEKIETQGKKDGKQKINAAFSFLSKKLASIKRHFFASPYQMMLDAISNNASIPVGKVPMKKPHQSIPSQKKFLPNLSYSVKQGGAQKVWISFSQTQFSVYYLVYFEDKSEQQLCRVFFSELLDSTKHVKAPPSISLSEREFPNALIKAFPQLQNCKYETTNGVICFTIFGNNVRKIQSIASNLANFRNYVYYHIQAQKCYLHSRILNIEADIDNSLKNAIIQPFALDKQKNFTPLTNS